MPELNPPTSANAPALIAADAQPPERRHEREQVEMMARLRRDIVVATVVLKDLTPLGARIEGFGPLQADEVIVLTLPECRPMIAFVAWVNTHGAGLEFVNPLPDDLFALLVTQYGLKSGEPTFG